MGSPTYSVRLLVCLFIITNQVKYKGNATSSASTQIINTLILTQLSQNVLTIYICNWKPKQPHFLNFISNVPKLQIIYSIPQLCAIFQKYGYYLIRMLHIVTCLNEVNSAPSICSTYFNSPLAHAEAIVVLLGQDDEQQMPIDDRNSHVRLILVALISSK